MEIPAFLRVVLDDFEAKNGAFTVDDVNTAVMQACQAAGELTGEVHKSAAREAIVFCLMSEAYGSEPWRRYFGPIGSGLRDGAVVYIPEVRDFDEALTDYWAARADAVRNPVLKARYADLVWDLRQPISGRKPEYKYALTACQAYLEAIERKLTVEVHDQMRDACRALDLACSIRNHDLTIRARDILLRLYNETVAQGGPWYKAFDRLITEKNAKLSDDDRSSMVGSLQALASRYAQVGVAEFDPHHLQSIARRLISYYGRLGDRGEVIRLHELTARAFEHIAGMGNATLASAHLQTAENAYADAGMDDDAKRVRIERAEAIRRSHDEMQTFSHTTSISKDDMDVYLAGLMRDQPLGTLAVIASEFAPRTEKLEAAVQESLKNNPLQALMPLSIMADDHQAATIGSVEDDLDGRVCHQALFHLQFNGLFLNRALAQAIERHGLTPHHFAGFAGRSRLLDDLTFALEGVYAWFDRDFIKTTFVLVPQVEAALRQLTRSLGRPVTKQHARMKGREVSINLGDILSDPAVKEALGPDLILYFKVLYADPRGLNLRNNIAHGLVSRDQIGSGIADLLMHTLLVLGVWKELADSRRKPAVQ